MKTTRKHLQDLLEEIAKTLKLAYHRDMAIKLKQKQYLVLEHSSIYGGYRVVNVGIENGAHYGAFGGNGTEARLKASEMYIRLSSILDGINAVKRK